VKRKINYHLLDAVNKSGYSPSKLSIKAGLSQSYISNVVNGQHQLSIRASRMIAKVVPGWNCEESLSKIGKRKLALAKHDAGIQMILELIERRDINHRMIADTIGVASSVITEITCGSRPMSSRTAYLIQEAFPEFDAERALGRRMGERSPISKP